MSMKSPTAYGRSLICTTQRLKLDQGFKTENWWKNYHLHKWEKGAEWNSAIASIHEPNYLYKTYQQITRGAGRKPDLGRTGK